MASLAAAAVIAISSPFPRVVSCGASITALLIAPWSVVCTNAPSSPDDHRHTETYKGRKTFACLQRPHFPNVIVRDDGRPETCRFMSISE